MFGLLVGFGALLMRLQGMMFGEPVGPAYRSRLLRSLFLHLLLVLVAGIYLPPPLVRWFQRVAELLG